MIKTCTYLYQTLETTEKSQILRKGIGMHVHGLAAVILYTSDTLASPGRAIKL